MIPVRTLALAVNLQLQYALSTCTASQPQNKNPSACLLKTPPARRGAENVRGNPRRGNMTQSLTGRPPSVAVSLGRIKVWRGFLLSGRAAEAVHRNAQLKGKKTHKVHMACCPCIARQRGLAVRTAPGTRLGDTLGRERLGMDGGGGGGRAWARKGRRQGGRDALLDSCQA